MVFEESLSGTPVVEIFLGSRGHCRSASNNIIAQSFKIAIVILVGNTSKINEAPQLKDT